MSSPLERTKKLLISLGYKTWITEKWNPFAHVRQDMFGFIDLLAIHPVNKVMLGVQTTSFAHRADHFRKIVNEPRAKDWLNSGGRIQLITWKEQRKNGKAVRHLPDFLEVQFGLHGELVGILGSNQSEYVLDNLEQNNEQPASPDSDQSNLVVKGDG